MKINAGLKAPGITQEYIRLETFGETRMNFDIEADIQFKAKLLEKVALYSRTLGAVGFAIGPVPIRVVPKFDVSATSLLSFDAAATATAGFDYQVSSEILTRF